MQKKYIRECLAVSSDRNEGASVLVVSTDEDRQSFNSEIFRYADIDSQSERIFQIDDWLSAMWVSDDGTYFLSGILGDCFSNITGAFVRLPASNSRLFKIWGLHERAVYAVGADGACVRFDGTRWQDMSRGLSAHLYAIGGTRDDALVCAGDGGFVARYDGAQWLPLDLPTNAAFRAVHVVSDDEFYLCGLDGACYRIVDGELQVIDADGHDLYSFARYQSDIYLGSTASGVFRLHQDSLLSVQAKAKAYKIAASGSHLWTCGLEQLARFDGKDWRKVDFL